MPVSITIPEVIAVNTDANKLLAKGDHKLRWNFPCWQNQYWLGASTADKQTISSLRSKINSNVKRDGFAIVDFKDLLANFDDAALLVTRVTGLIGMPIKVFDNEPGHWRVIDVDLSRPENRSRGIGKIPLHMDFVNAQFPPDVVCLLCKQHDPLGDGASLVCDFRGWETELSLESKSALSQAVFRDGMVRNLSNVGKDTNPFPVINTTGDVRFRFTANLMDGTYGLDVTNALTELEQFLKKRVVRFDLKQGMLLLVDQNCALHGREPVGQGQEYIKPEERRLVLHSFLRYN